jgi:DnaJ-class molecular chaperone
MANFDDIDEARKLLGLGEEATLKEIRSVYRRMVSRYHPDKHINDDASQYEETMKKLNWAYKVLTEYCRDYKYTFREEDVARTYPSEEYMRNWYKKWSM